MKPIKLLLNSRKMRKNKELKKKSKKKSENKFWRSLFVYLPLLCDSFRFNEKRLLLSADVCASWPIAHAVRVERAFERMVTARHLLANCGYISLESRLNDFVISKRIRRPNACSRRPPRPRRQRRRREQPNWNSIPDRNHRTLASHRWTFSAKFTIFPIICLHPIECINSN